MSIFNKKSILAVGATLALAATAMAQNRSVFPSPWNPAGLERTQVTQYVFFSWDDNAYSGLTGTQYENDTLTVNWETGQGLAFVGGVTPWGAQSQNPANIVETPTGWGQRAMGMQWAYWALARGNSITASGPQNSGIPMTFNMISGLFVDRPTGTWDDAESVLGYFRPSPQESTAHRRIAVTWGREFALTAPGAGTNSENRNNIAVAVNRLLAAGSEVGNHTVDHMESNSPLAGPSAQFSTQVQQRTIQAGGRTWNVGFGNWNNEGFATERMNQMNWGVSIDEATEFGQTPGHTAQSRGWLIFAGRQISEEAWYQYIRFSELFLRHQGPGWTAPDLNLASDPLHRNITGIRAPRLEVNSALFFALARANYTYDMGLEDGYEWHRTGPNFLWPYTMCNGVQNSWTQFSQGNRVFLDSTPGINVDGTGRRLWQLHVTPVIVPEHLRDAVWSNHAEIMAGAGTPTGSADRDHWLLHGKITGFDFNTWILYGMTGDNWQATMQHTFNLRNNGNRAPMQFGLHTDYYTPIYDNATLLNSFNRNGWGLPVVRGWNTWITRQNETEAFVNFALNQGAQFVSGAQLVQRLENLAAQGEARIQSTLPASALPNEWTWVSTVDGDQNNASSTALNNLSGNIRIQSTFTPDQPRFMLDVSNVDLSQMTHISLNYRQTSASMLRLILDNGEEREVMLAHRFPIVSNHVAGNVDNGNFGRAALRNSGLIPISAFDFPPTTEHPMDYTAVDVSRVIAIEIQPLAPFARPIEFGQAGWSNVQRTEAWEARFEFRDLTIHLGQPFDFDGGNLVDPGQPVSIARVNRNRVGSLNIAGITNNALNLNVAQAGIFNIGIYSVSGRLIQSFNSQNLTTGLNTLRLNNLARGVHIVRIQGVNVNQSLTRQVILR